MELFTPAIGLIIWTLLSLGALVLTLMALFSILKSSFKDSTTKLIWILVIIFLPIAGPVSYFILGRKQRVITV
jgi:hypothetical protein